MRSTAGARKGASGSRSDHRPQSFPRDKRLSRRSQFRRVYDTGRKVHAGRAVLFLLENDAGGPRLGITVTRKVGNAVLRNGLKRRVREIFRKNAAAVGRHWDIVIHLKPNAAGASVAELETDILTALGRASSRQKARGDK